MLTNKKIALVEDDAIIRDTIRGFMAQFNCTLFFEADGFDSGLKQLSEKVPELILLDIRLGEEKSGIMLGNYIRKQFPETAIIFITSLTDSETLSMASVVSPEGYIVKPFRAEDLRVAIELAFRKKNFLLKETNDLPTELFVKNGHSHEKLILSEIVFLQAEGNYVKVRLLNGKSLLIRSGLREFTLQLPEEKFFQVHKSWVVNLALVKSVSASQVIVANETVPLSPNFRDALFERLNIPG